MFSPSYLHRNWSISRRQIGFGWSTRPPPTVQLANLNDACLDSIFQHLSLQSLLHSLLPVCTRFKSLVEKRCSQTKELVLLGPTIKHQTSPKPQITLVISKHLNAPHFASLFANLTTLSITFDRHTPIDDLTALLRNLHLLSVLHLSGHAHFTSKSQLPSLLSAINTLASLISLNLHLKNLLTEADLTSHLAWILPQLETLSLTDCPFNLYPVLKQLKSIKSLSLQPLPLLTTVDVLKRAFTKNKQLAKGLVNLRLSGLKKESDIAQVVASRALGLQELSFNEVTLTTDLIKSLRKLKNLTTLTLDRLVLSPKVHALKVTPSYQVLSLTSLILSHITTADDLTSDLPVLGAVFPNVETLSIASTNPCTLWSIEKSYKASFKYLKVCNLVDLTETTTNPTTRTSIVSLNGRSGSLVTSDEATESLFDQSSLVGNTSLGPGDELSFRSLVLAMEKITEEGPLGMETSLEHQESVD